MEEPIDRFTLEAQIMNCWNVVDDLKMLADRSDCRPENTQALALIYQMKFEILFETFEQLISEGRVT